jgi:hypothetical protein
MIVRLAVRRRNKTPDDASPGDSRDSVPGVFCDQILPSGPVAIPLGTLPELRSLNSVMGGVAAIATPGHAAITATTRPNWTIAMSLRFARTNRVIKPSHTPAIVPVDGMSRKTQ